jgi:phosphatidylglycerophosphatase A
VPRSLVLVLASFFGAGYAPKASGTVGTLAAMPLAFLVSRLSTPAQLAVAVLVTVVAIPIAHAAGKALGVVDSGRIVIDEVAGLLVTFVGVSFTWPAALLGFVLFRLFDITKPWPASYFDRKVKNGAGVVLDDVAAGLFARAGLALALWLWPGAFGA